MKRRGRINKSKKSFFRQSKRINKLNLKAPRGGFRL